MSTFTRPIVTKLGWVITSGGSARKRLKVGIDFLLMVFITHLFSTLKQIYSEDDKISLETKVN